MKDSRKLFAWLRSLWGALAGTVIAFPAAAAILRMPIAVERSQITSFYPVLGSLAAAVSVLMIAALAEGFKGRKAAIMVSILSALLAFGSIFGFLYVRVYYLDREFHSIDTIHHPVLGEYSRIAKSKGLIHVAQFSTRDQETPFKEEIYGDPVDIMCLALFCLAFGSFASVFSVLGVHLYENRKA